MLHANPPRESISAFLLTWLVAPLIAIGIGMLAGALAVAGALTAVWSGIVRTLRPPARMPERLMPVPLVARRNPVRLRTTDGARLPRP